MEREILTVEEAAEFLRVDRKTVYVYVARRKIPHQRLGKRIILSRSALIAWIAAGPGSPGWGAREYGQHLAEYSSQIGPSLYALVAEGKLIRTGQRRMTRYYLPTK